MQAFTIDHDALIARLPTLQGSEKQIAWAETIRAEQVPMLIENARSTLASLTGEDDDAKFAPYSTAAREELAQDALNHLEQLLLRDDASEWIDTRSWFDTQVIYDKKLHSERIRHLPIFLAERKALRAAA